jgi:transposase
VATEFHLDWKTVKDLEKDYMLHQLERTPKARPKVIGIDEVSIRRGHTYRVTVSNPEARRSIWFGGQDTSKKSMRLFYQLSIGPVKSAKIRFAAMDMWKPFETVAQQCAAQSAILQQVPRHAASRSSRP